MTIPDLPEHDADYLRIAEYLQGKCLPADAARMASELAVDPQLQYAAELLRLALPSTPTTPTSDIDAWWADLTDRIDEREHPRSRFARRLKRVAQLAGAAGLLVFAWATYESLAPVVAGHYNERYEAPMESRRVIRLPDGSRVTLEPGARLTYRASFFPRPRTMALEGEARFQARPDAERPFEVHANSVVVRAIGTVFTVRANLWESAVHISVEQGVVRAGSETSTSSHVVAAGDSIDVPVVASPSPP